MNRTIPAEYLDKTITVTWERPGIGPQRFTGILVFSGEYTIRLKYFRRNHETKKVRSYIITIPSSEMIDWKVGAVRND